MEEVRSRYREVHQEEEKPIKIEKLWLFPLRGIKGIEVPEIKVSKWGIKYDREWTIYEKGKGCIT
jgi:uncharacterized protein YcbX